MKSFGIVAEYNPFHEGHRYLIGEARRITGAEICVSVMSGDFTQRGEPAVYDKWTRAEAAVKGGCDLVAELPCVYSCGSAQYFASGALSVLEGFGCIDYLAFGSESGDIRELEAAARFLRENQEEIQEGVRLRIRRGESYPRARMNAIAGMEPGFDLSILEEPNNILAIEYLNSCRTLQPVTVKRTGESHHQTASSIRAGLEKEMGAFLQDREERYFLLVRSRILQMSAEELERIDSAGEGLGRKLKQEVRYASTLEELVDRLKSKAYTRTRIQRLLTQVLLGITGDQITGASPYIRILALSPAGAAFLKEVKKRESSRLPILTNINKEAEAHPEILPTLHQDILASDLYNLISQNDMYEFSDHVKRPFIGIGRSFK